MTRDIYLDYARLAAPPPSGFISELSSSLSRLDQYPDTHFQEAKEAIACRHNVHADNIALGNGADELIDSITRLISGDILIPTPTFGQYEEAAKRCGRTVRKVDCISDSRYDLTALEPYIERAGLTWICNPNNPMGCELEKSQIEWQVDNTAGVVVVDEACIGFSDKNTFIHQAPKLENLLVVRTFSKSFGLAGLRMGYAVGNQETIFQLENKRQPFNLNRVAQEAIPLALRMEGDFKKRYLEMVKRRDKFGKDLGACGYHVLPSQTNFVTLQLPDARSSMRLFECLRRRRIHVLPPGSDEFSGIPKEWIRITVGSDKENQTVVNALNLFAK
jgi:histidinol-phosphate aminotransferase